VYDLCIRGLISSPRYIETPTEELLAEEMPTEETPGRDAYQIEFDIFPQYFTLIYLRVYNVECEERDIFIHNI